MQGNDTFKSLFIAGLMVFVLGVAGLGFFMLIGSTSKTPTTASTSGVTSGTKNIIGTGTSTSTSAAGYTSAQVASHNTSGSCWLIIDSQVYDVSKFLYGGSHRAGNQVILQYCGSDASSAFTVHNNSGYNVLAQYLIGKLI